MASEHSFLEALFDMDEEAFESFDDATHDVSTTGAIVDDPIVGLKRGRKAISAELSFEIMKKRFIGLDASAEWVARWEKEQLVRCRVCNKTISGEAMRNNITRHFTKLASHKEAVTMQLRALPLDKGFEIQKTMATTEELLRVKSAGTLAEFRGYFAGVSSTLMVKSNIAKIFETEFAADMALLSEMGAPVTPETIVADIERCRRGVMGRAKELIRKKPVCIIADEAPTFMVGYKRPIAILLASPYLRKPLLIALVFRASGDGGAADRAANAIKCALDELEISIHDQVTSFVGDNLQFNDAVAERLGVQRLRCIPNSLQLVFKALTKRFKLFETVTLQLSSILKVGGTVHRTEALRDAGLAVERLHCTKTRCNQMQHASRYLQEGFAEHMKFGVYLAVRKVLTNHVAFDADVLSDDSDTGVTETVRNRLVAIKEAFECGTVDEDCRHRAACELCLVEELTGGHRAEGVITGGLPELIELASADTHTLSPDFESKLSHFRSTLVKCIDMPQLTLQSVFDTDFTDFESDEKAQLLAMYTPLVVASAREALQVYDKYIPDALAVQRYRLMYDPMCRPPTPPARSSHDQLLDIGVLESFVGCIPGKADVQLYIEWKMYCSNWDALPEVLKSSGISNFWTNETIQAEYPRVSEVAMWYATLPISSVAAERTFGVMRAMEPTLRGRFDTDSLEEELMNTVNGWILNDLRARARSKLE